MRGIYLALSSLMILLGFDGQADAQEKVVYAVTTSNISVGHAAQSSIPLTEGFWKAEGLDVEVIVSIGAPRRQPSLSACSKSSVKARQT